MDERAPGLNGFILLNAILGLCLVVVVTLEGILTLNSDCYRG